MAQVRIRSNFQYRKLWKPPGPQKMRQLINMVIAHIRRRTMMQGMSSRGVPFAPYSPNSRKAGQRVDLYDSGAMLDGLQALSTGDPKIVRAGWVDPALEMRAFYNEKGSRRKPRRPPRPFLHVDERDLRRIIRQATGLGGGRR